MLVRIISVRLENEFVMKKEPVVLYLLLLLMFGCGGQQVEKRVEDGVEVVLNAIEPYKIRGQTFSLQLEEVMSLDTEDPEVIGAGLIDINADFFQRSCAALVVDGYYDKFGACDYCYAKGTHKGDPTKRVLTADKKSLVEQIKDIRKTRRAEVLRLGKISECGSKMTREQLITTLEACIETGTKVIFPTKFLEFDEELALLMRRAK